MVNCRYRIIDENEFFRVAAGEKQVRFRLLLQASAERVISSYQNYLQNFQLVCNMESSEFNVETEKEIRDALQLCYSSATTTFKMFRSNVFIDQPKAIKVLCPYCMMDQPKTLDHYVGQKEFPEFSILTKNLVPCCWSCNTVKKDMWRMAGSRKYINFYDDQFLRYPFLWADFELTPETAVPLIVYRLEIPPEIQDSDFSIISSHFLALDLLRQYGEKANARLSTEIETLKSYFEIGLDDGTIERLLLTRWQEFARDFGPNYWEAVIYRTLANSLPTIRGL